MPAASIRTRFTRSVTAREVDRAWLVVDARDQVLGRLASEVATRLRGKHKPFYTSHVDCGDFVIVINASLVRLTGRKREQKLYWRHSGYPGSIRSVTAGRLLETYPARVIENAVRGMLPKTRLGRQMLKKLKVYPGAEHPHAAQKPEPSSSPVAMHCPMGTPMYSSGTGRPPAENPSPREAIR